MEQKLDELNEFEKMTRRYREADYLVYFIWRDFHEELEKELEKIKENGELESYVKQID